MLLQLHSAQVITASHRDVIIPVNVNLKAQLILPRIEKSSQLNEIQLLFIEKNDIRRFEN